MRHRCFNDETLHFRSFDLACRLENCSAVITLFMSAWNAASVAATLIRTVGFTGIKQLVKVAFQGILEQRCSIRGDMQA